MSSIPLNLVKPLLLSHMTVVANPENMKALFAAFECANKVWPQYTDNLMKFGDTPLDKVEHDIEFHCMMVMSGAKYKVSKEDMMTVGMKLVEQLWLDTGLSVDDFCALIEQPHLPELTNKLRTFLHTLMLADADESKVQ